MHLTLRNLKLSVSGRDSHTLSVGLYEDREARKLNDCAHYIQTLLTVATSRLGLSLDQYETKRGSFFQIRREASA